MVAQTDIKWTLAVSVWKFIDKQSAEFQAQQIHLKAAFKSTMTDYFNTGTLPCAEQGLGIFPIVHGDIEDNRKAFKVRLAVPGAGKRGGLRLIVAVDCNKKRVEIVDADFRKDVG